MFCKNCGQALDNGVRFCPNCGTETIAGVPVPPAASDPVAPRPATYAPPRDRKEKSIALILCFFLGCFGVHKLYLKEQKEGCVMLVIGLFGLFLLIPLLVTGIWSLINLIQLLTMGSEEFDRKYNC